LVQTAELAEPAKLASPGSDRARDAVAALAGGSSHRVAPGEPDEKVRTRGFALEIGAPVAQAAGTAVFGASVRDSGPSVVGGWHRVPGGSEIVRLGYCQTAAWECEDVATPGALDCKVRAGSWIRRSA
jgi:hypothetical protein